MRRKPWQYPVLAGVVLLPEHSDTTFAPCLQTWWPCLCLRPRALYHIKSVTQRKLNRDLPQLQSEGHGRAPLGNSKAFLCVFEVSLHALGGSSVPVFATVLPSTGALLQARSLQGKKLNPLYSTATAQLSRLSTFLVQRPLEKWSPLGLSVAHRQCAGETSKQTPASLSSFLHCRYHRAEVVRLSRGRVRTCL